MSLQEVMQAIESHRFAAELNLASGSSIFYRGLQNHRLFRELSDHVNEPGAGAREAILARLLQLSRQRIELQYGNPFDTAMTTYLTVLDQVENPETLSSAAEAVSKAPNCWWAAEASMRLQSKVKLHRLRQPFSLGKIEIESLFHSEARTLGRMTGYELSFLSVASAPANAARGFNRHRKKKRVRAVDGNHLRPQQQVWPQLAQQQIP